MSILKLCGVNGMDALRLAIFHSNPQVLQPFPIERKQLTMPANMKFIVWACKPTPELTHEVHWIGASCQSCGMSIHATLNSL